LHQLDHYPHAGMRQWVEDLNRLYRSEPALYELDSNPAGFEWVDCADAGASVLSFLRKGRSPQDTILVICNFTPVPRFDYQVGVPHAGYWRELLNSDSHLYGGSGLGNLGGTDVAASSVHGRPCSLTLTLPPLSVLFFKVGENTAGTPGV
jgi:1,4-alpha-glucan branching enzyme